MAFLQKERLFTRKWFISYGLIAVGTLMVAAGYVFFITPYKIVPGGIYGISIIIHHLMGWPVGLTALAFNIPLTIIGTKILANASGLKRLQDFSSLPYLLIQSPITANTNLWSTATRCSHQSLEEH